MSLGKFHWLESTFKENTELFKELLPLSPLSYGEGPVVDRTEEACPRAQSMATAEPEMTPCPSSFFYCSWGLTVWHPQLLCLLFYLFILKFLAMQCPPQTPGGISVPWPGTKPVPPALEAWSLNHWTAREAPRPSSCQYRRGSMPWSKLSHLPHPLQRFSPEGPDRAHRPQEDAAETLRRLQVRAATLWRLRLPSSRGSWRHWITPRVMPEGCLCWWRRPCRETWVMQWRKMEMLARCLEELDGRGVGGSSFPTPNWLNQRIQSPSSFIYSLIFFPLTNEYWAPPMP